MLAAVPTTRRFLALLAAACPVLGGSADAAGASPGAAVPPDLRDRLDRAVVVAAIDVEAVEVRASADPFGDRIATVDVLDVPLDGPGAHLVSAGDTVRVDIGPAGGCSVVDWRPGDRLLVDLRPTGAADAPWTVSWNGALTAGAANTAFLADRVREWAALRVERDDRRRAALVAEWFVRLCEHPEGLRLASTDLVGHRDGRPVRAHRHPTGFPRFDAAQRTELIQQALVDRGDPDPRSLRRRIDLLEAIGDLDEDVLEHAEAELRRRLDDGPGPPHPLARMPGDGRLLADSLHDHGLRDLLRVLRRHHPIAAAAADEQLRRQHAGRPTGRRLPLGPAAEEAEALLAALDG